MIKKLFLITSIYSLFAMEQKKINAPRYSACLTSQQLNNLHWNNISQKPKTTIFFMRFSTQDYLSDNYRHTFYIDTYHPGETSREITVIRQKITDPFKGNWEQTIIPAKWLCNKKIVEIFLSFGDPYDPPREIPHKK
jgi:hypothetical protein